MAVGNHCIIASTQCSKSEFQHCYCYHVSYKSKAKVKQSTKLKCMEINGF